MENGTPFNDIESMDAGAFFDYLDRMSSDKPASDEDTQYLSAVEFYNQF